MISEKQKMAVSPIRRNSKRNTKSYKLWMGK